MDAARTPLAANIAIVGVRFLDRYSGLNPSIDINNTELLEKQSLVGNA